MDCGHAYYIMQLCHIVSLFYSCDNDNCHHKDPSSSFMKMECIWIMVHVKLDKPSISKRAYWLFHYIYPFEVIITSRSLFFCFFPSYWHSKWIMSWDSNEGVLHVCLFFFSDQDIYMAMVLSLALVVFLLLYLYLFTW